MGSVSTGLAAKVVASRLNKNDILERRWVKPPELLLIPLAWNF